MAVPPNIGKYRYLLIVVCVLTTLGAGQVPPNYFGMMVHRATPANWPSIALSTLRIYDNGAAWSSLNPAPGTYNWGALDYWLEMSAAHGTDVLYTFGRTPNWAISGTCTGGYAPNGCAEPPASLQYWDDFVRAIATHAAGRIKYWEMWNEPTETSISWTGGIPLLVTMTQHASAIIKSIDPSAVIVSPGTDKNTATASYCNQVLGLTCGSNWTAAYLAAGARNYVDVIAFHGYAGTDPESVIGLIQLQRTVMSANGVGSLPLWDTEDSWENNTRITNLSDRAAFVVRKYLIERSYGVSRVYWNAWDSPSYGTLWSPTNGIEPAGKAYVEVSNWLSGASLNACIKGPDSTWKCSLTRAGGYQAEVLWNPSATVSYAFPAQFGQYRTLTGSASPLTGSSVMVSSIPIMVETPAATTPPLPTPPSPPVTQPDFVIAAHPVPGTHNATFEVVVTPTSSSFELPVNLACASFPAQVRCSWSASSVTPGARSAVTTLTVYRAPTLRLAAWFWTLPLCSAMLLSAPRRIRRPVMVPIVIVIALALAQIGCSGLGTTVQPTKASPATLNAAPIILTIVGRSGSLQHSTSVQVSVR